MATTMEVYMLPKDCTLAYHVDCVVDNSINHRQIWNLAHHTALLIAIGSICAMDDADCHPNNYLWTATLHYLWLHGCLSYIHHCSEAWLWNYLAYYILAHIISLDAQILSNQNIYTFGCLFCIGFWMDFSDQ